MLKADLIGRIGNDAVVKNFNGKDFISFNVAHSEKYTDAQGIKRERTTWVSCLKPGDATSPVLAYLRKGTQVFVRGDLTAKAYTTADKGLQAGLNIRVTELQLLGSKSDGQQQPDQQQQGAPTYGTTPGGYAANPYGGQTAPGYDTMPPAPNDGDPLPF